MTRLALLLLLACGGKETDSSPPDPPTDSAPTSPSTGVTTATVPAPALVDPAPAEDLDPAPDAVRIELTAAPHTFEVAGQTVDGWAYNGQVPGPTIRAKVGDTVTVQLTNDLPDPTTIHWHGLHVPWDMDGVVWMQDPIAPGEVFEYRFTLTQTGTFWYHPHFDTERQVDLGLYGAFVVTDPADPVVDEERVLVFDTWAEAEAATVDGAHHHGPDATVRTWTVNGLALPEWTPPTGSVSRLRVLNVSNTGYLHLPSVRQIGGEAGIAAALVDGPLVLGPGDRADLEWTASEPTALTSLPYAAAGGPAWGEPIDLLTVAPAGADIGSAPPAWPTTGAAPTADPGQTDILWVFHGESAAASWMINGEQFPDVTIPQTPLDTDAVVELRNLSAAEHPFHLHGMAFEVLSVDGVAPPHQRIEDTLNLPIGTTARLLIHPRESGDWMAHCHILPHAELGMMTVLRVP